jgi:NAD(P)-dependent dehydrogenase (short-subunit alcohol dehydrogenase family)
MRRFEGKIAYVTGAGSGLGRATALRLAQEGASVACLDINEGAAKETVEAILGTGAVAEVFGVDVSDEASVAAAVAAARAELGVPDVVCNIAGIGGFAHTHELPMEQWQRILGVNLTGTFLMCKFTLPLLLDRNGAIVNVASTAGIRSQPYSAAYCASKGGVIAMTRALALEYVDRGVRVNAIAPGGMDTPMIQSFSFPEGANPEKFAGITSPMGFSQPSEVASTIAYVASDEARYMTGSVVVIDGGITM